MGRFLEIIVSAALAQAVAPDELRDMAAQLSKDYQPVLSAAGIGREMQPSEDPVANR